MAAEPEAFAAVQRRDLRSVLRVGGRAWWLVVVLAAALGTATAVSKSRGPTIYASRSVVIAVSTSIPVENFEIALTLFATDEVIASVTEALGIDATTQQVLATRTLEADWVTGGGLEITGRSTDPEAAVDLSNLAAESFSTTLGEKELGTFAVLPARSASVIERGGPILDAIAGVALGALLAVILLAIRFLILQPIVSEQDALAEFPADKAYGVSLRSRSGGNDSLGSGAVAHPVGIESALIRDAGLESDYEGAVCCVLFEKGRGGDPAVRHLLERMNVLQRWAPDAELTKYWLTPEDGVPLEALERAGTVFLMVSEGCRRRPLREVAEEVMALSSGPTSWILVFVKRRRVRRSTRRAQARNGLLRRLSSLRGRPSRTPL